MSDPFDLDAYLSRIGYAGARRADIATLSAIHAAHPAAIPFENLDALLGRPVKLDLPSLHDKIVARRRGGYCFEQNTLLEAALEALGFSLTRLGARVRWGAPPEEPEGPRAHMALLVDLAEGAYLVDVGFGGYMLSGPVRLDGDGEQTDAGSPIRAALADRRYTLQLQRGGQWRDIYRFSLEPQVAADYLMGSWWTAAHPESLFVSNLLMERMTPEVRYGLFNKRLTTRYADGRVEERTVTGPEDLGQLLANAFAIDPPASAEEIWARLPKG